MKQIHLHGSLKARFGGPFTLDVRDPAEAVRALATQLPGFREAIEAGHWHVIRGPLEGGESVDEDGLLVALGSADEMHILPAVEGASNGVFNAIAGAVLLVVGVVTQQYYLAAAGAGMMIGGVVQMTTKVPGSDYDDRERPDERPSFLFDGPVNTSTQGLPVPVGYGRLRVGSVVISAGMSVEEI